MNGTEPADFSSCAVVKGDKPAVQVSDQARQFVWLSVDGKTLVADSLDAHKKIVDLDAKRGSIRLALEGSSDRGWPSPSTIELVAGKSVWKVALPAESASHLREIRVPRGRYDLRILATHHDRLTRTEIEVDGKPADLGTIALSPLPRFAATATTREGTPLSGAVLIDDSEKTVAHADQLGRISYEPECTEKIRDCGLAARFTIEYPGRAGTRVLVMDRKKDFDAGRIVLGEGGALDLKVVRKTAKPFPVNVEVVEEPSRRVREKPRVVASGSIAPGDDEIHLEKLPAGTSGLYLRGDEPDEVLSRKVVIRSGETTGEKIEIHPTRLNIHATVGDAPLAGAKVTVAVPLGKPSHEVVIAPTDDDGRAWTTIWEDGVVVVDVDKDDLSGTAFVKIEDRDSQDVDLHISATTIHGRVFDADSREPLRHVKVLHDWMGKTQAEKGLVQTDDEGRFEMRSAGEGTHTFTVNATDYLPAKASIETTSADVDRTLDIPVSKGQQYRLQARWTDGQPIRGASVVESAGSTYTEWTTDEGGVATIPMARDSTKDVWIIPHEGSFAFATISAGDQTSVVTLARPAGALLVRTVDEDGTSAPSGHLGFRYNGRTLGFHVGGFIIRNQGVDLRTGSDGSVVLRGFPPGQYDVWAVQYDGNDLIVDAPLPKQKVESFYYAGGDQTVTVEAKPFGER